VASGRLSKRRSVSKRAAAASHEVGPARASGEQGVSREEMTFHEHREGVRRVPRGVDDRRHLRAELEGRAALDPPHRALEFRSRVGEHGRAGPSGEPAHPGEMVRVGVGVEDERQARIVGRERLDEPVDLIQPGIDCQGGAAGPVHDQIAQAAVARRPKGVDRESLGRERCHVLVPPDQTI
jgi:hypothetical protein